MLKKSIFLFLLTLFISGCVERGQSVNPQYITQNKNVSTETNTTIVKPIYMLRLDANKSDIDTIKNSVTGTMLLVIGIIIFL